MALATFLTKAVGVAMRNPDSRGGKGVEPPATGVPPHSFRPLDAGGDIAARCPYHAVTAGVATGWVGMARCAVPVAERERQATERTACDGRLTAFVPPAGRGRGHRSAMSLPKPGRPRPKIPGSPSPGPCVKVTP